jgi:hypothetical protein
MKRFSIVIFILAGFHSFAQNKTYNVRNSTYSIKADVNSVLISAGGHTRTLTPIIQVIESSNDPLMSEKKSDNNLSPQVSWNNPWGLKKAPDVKATKQPSTEY